MIKLAGLIMVMLLTSGFIGLGHKKMNESQKKDQMNEVRKLLNEGQFYKAGQMAAKIQKQFPQDPQAVDLLKEIDTRREMRHKQILSDPTEELTDTERQDAIKTGEERAKGFLRSRHYGEAADSAQEIFRYDPNNRTASKILDQVSQASHKEAQHEEALLRHVYRDELTERLETYRQEAHQFMDQEQWGRARFAVEKMLILAPSDSEAKRLYTVINERLGKKAA